MLPDQVLQQQLLRPTGTVPSYLVMSELQRRKEMRNEYQSRPGPQRSMVEEYAQGMDSGPPQGAGGGLAQLLASPPPGGQQGVQPGQGQVGPSGLGLAPQPPQGMMPPQQQPMGFADGGEVGGYSPMAQYRRMMELLQRQRMSLPPGGMPQAQSLPNTPPIVLPNMPQQMVPEGPPSPPDTRTMLQRFQGAMANQSPDASVMAADAIRSIPPIDWQSIGTGPGAEEQARRYQDEMLRAAETPGLFTRRDGKSLGQSIAENLQGVPRRMPMAGGVQDYPPDVTADPFAKLDPSSFGNTGETGASPQGERPRLEIGGEPPEWLTQSPFKAALMQPKEMFPGADTIVFGGDRPPTGRPAVPPGGGPGVAMGLPPPGGGGGHTVNSGPPGGGPQPQGGMLANQGLDDIMAGMTQARGPDRYADLVAQNQQAKADLLAGRDADRGMALLTAGLGMMAGQSPNAWTNIGQGALLGVRNWENASKEMRMAERDLRNADQAIAIAQANRDERAVEMAFKQKAMAEEALLRREALAAQREATASARADALDVRRSAATEAAQNRADMLALRRMEIEDNSKTRGESREQNRIAELGTAAKIANGQADQIETKILAITSNVGNNTSDPAIKAQIEALTRQAQERRAEAERYSQMHQQSIVEREIRSGRLVQIDPTRKGYDSNGNKLKNGQMFATPNGSIGRWTE